MTLSSLVREQVESRIRARGLDYYRRGKVQISGGSSLEVEARVAGNSIYDVLLFAEYDGELSFFCTCPYFDQEWLPCKHVWATLLAAEDAGFFEELREAWDIELVPIDDGEAEARSSHGPGDDDETLAAPTTEFPLRLVRQEDRQEDRPGDRPGDERGDRRGRKDDGWSDQFRELLGRERDNSAFHTATRAKNSDTEVIYVLNVARTLREQNLILEIHRRARRKTGEWGLLRPFNVTGEVLDEMSDAADRQILALLFGARNPYEWNFSHYRYEEKRNSFVLPPETSAVLIPLLCRTGRFRLELPVAPAGGRDSLPVALDEGPPWRFQVTCRRSTDGLHWELVGHFARDGETMSLDEPLLITDRWLFGPAGAAAVEQGGAFAWISHLRKKKLLRVPAEDADRMLELVFRSRNPPPIDWPDGLKPTEVSEPPRLMATIAKHSRDMRQKPKLRVEVAFVYGDEMIGATESRGRIFVPEERKLLLRDRQAEAAAWERLKELDCQPPPAYRMNHHAHEDPYLELASKKLPRVVNALLEDGWIVEAEGALHRLAGQFSMSVRSGIDWFDLDGAADFDGVTVALPKLLEAARRKETRVLLDDGSYGIVPEDWLKRFGFLLSAGDVQEDLIRFRPSQALLLDALLAAEDDSSWDRTFEKARTALSRFEGIKARKAPAGFRGELRPYQKEGLGWFAFLQKFRLGGCLADDMGLGKTIQVLALLESRRRARGGKGDSKCDGGKRRVMDPATEPETEPETTPSLVVMPRSLIFNWLSEAARFAPKLKILDHTGPARLKETSHLLDHDVVFTTYGTLRTDISLLKEVPFDYVVLDESQAIKNRTSQTAKAARLLNGRHRLGLSGTPIENHLDELFSLFEFLNPGMLGASKAFKQFGSTNASGRNRGDKNGGDESSRAEEEAQRMLSRVVRPFILRRTKGAVAPDLPERLEQTIQCDLTPYERKRYDEVREYYRASLAGKIETVGLKRSKIQVLEALLRMRQAACHPGLLDAKQRDRSSAKVDLLLDRLRELQGEGRKALVFSQFTTFLSIVRDRLDGEGLVYEYLDGRTRNRGRKVERFQDDPDCPLFLISLKAGGLGLNLTAAEYVFLLDPWWNPAVESQAIDRAHRIGQECRVFAYRLIARDTVEEKIITLQQKKRKLADAIISADGNVIRDLTREDLEFILS